MGGDLPAFASSSRRCPGPKRWTSSVCAIVNLCCVDDVSVQSAGAGLLRGDGCECAEGRRTFGHPILAPSCCVRGVRMPRSRRRGPGKIWLRRTGGCMDRISPQGRTRYIASCCLERCSGNLAGALQSGRKAVEMATATSFFYTEGIARLFLAQALLEAHDADAVEEQ